MRKSDQRRKKIKIYDNVLGGQFLDYINFSMVRLKWELHSSTTDPKTPLFFTSVVLDKNERKPEFEYLFRLVTSTAINDLQTSTGKKYNVELEKGYVNLYPFGVGGDWHIDSRSTDGKTILFYPSDWKEEYKGATEFQSGEKVEYRKNRLLVFDGTIPHRCAIHHNPKNRYTIAFKIFTKQVPVKE